MENMQKQLFLANRALIEKLVPIPQELLAFEQRWIDDAIERSMTADVPGDLAGLRRMLAELVELESSEVPPSAHYVGSDMTLDEFRILVQEFALDGLTEAQVFYHLMPRLSLAEHLHIGKRLIGGGQGGDMGVVQFQAEPGEQAPADITVERQLDVGLVACQLANLVFVVVGIKQVGQGEAESHDDQQQPENKQPQDFAERFHGRVLVSIFKNSP